MRAKKTGITPARHVEIGRQIQGIRYTIMGLISEVSAAYTLTGPDGRYYRALRKAYQALDEVRNQADNVSGNEYNCPRDDSPWCTCWYYPEPPEKGPHCPKGDLNRLREAATT